MFEATILIIAVMLAISVFAGSALYSDWQAKKKAIHQ